jgi:hypothetical protein
MEYLDAMGIPMFVPRRILPGARASAQAVLAQRISAEDALPLDHSSVNHSPVNHSPVNHSPVNHSPVNEVPPMVDAPTVPRPAPTAVSDIVNTFTRPASRTDAPLEPPLAAPTAAAEPPVQFALSIWRPSPALMIIDSRHAGGALPTQALLENILHAKGLSLPPRKPDIVIWPPAGMAPTPGWHSAREMLQAFLQARLEQQPAQYLWLMGESACHAVLADRPFQENLGLAVNLDALASLAVVLPSLADMLQQPALKARTWAAIRALHVG